MHVERHNHQRQRKNAPGAAACERITAHTDNHQAHDHHYRCQQIHQTHYCACLPDVHQLAGRPSNQHQGQTDSDDIEKNGHQHAPSPFLRTAGMALSPRLMANRMPPIQIRCRNQSYCTRKAMLPLPACRGWISMPS